MSIREVFEKREKGFLSPYGCLSSETKGRQNKEEPCSIRTAFQLDRDRIVYSNAFRRLKFKTQVFLSPLGDDYRTRLTHTLEVAQIARTIARALSLNEDLTEAIALGHDLGHPPFGHSGEAALQEINLYNFFHSEQSVRIVDVLENGGKGLNLTYEVRDGILKHSKGFGNIMPTDPKDKPCTAEGEIVRIADLMAYLNHDLDDAIRSKVISLNQVPASCMKNIGDTHSKRATTMIEDIISFTKVSNKKLNFNFSDKVYSSMTTLREFLYKNVYRSEHVHKEFLKAKRVMSELYTYFLNNHNALQKELEAMGIGWHIFENQSIERTVCDFVASMTDRHALNLYTKIFFPCPIV